MMDQIQMGLSRLSPQELQRLDQLLTPELAGLLIKVVPDLEPMLAPLMGQSGQGGEEPQGMPVMGPGPQAPMPMATGAPPRPQGGLGQVTAVPQPQFRR